MTKLNGKTAVVALGGNAITQPGIEDTIATQFANTRKSLDGVVELVRAGYKLAITHGNGPQVGNLFLAVDKGKCLNSRRGVQGEYALVARHLSSVYERGDIIPLPFNVVFEG